MDIEALAPPAPATTTEETGAVASIIPTADRDRWLTTIEVQEYLQLTPAEYTKLILDGTLKNNGASSGTRLHDRHALRELLVDRVGEGEAKRAWSRLQDRWSAEDEAYAASGRGAVEALQRKAAGAPAMKTYTRRADPLEGNAKFTASTGQTAAAPAPYRAAWDEAHEAIQAGWRVVAEQQRADRKAATANRAQALSTAGLKRSTMTAVEKARFLEAHGQAAYFQLPK